MSVCYSREMTSLSHDFMLLLHLDMLSGQKSMKKNASKTKKNTSLRLESKVLKALKMRALEEDTSVQKILEKLIKDYLKK